MVLATIGLSACDDNVDGMLSVQAPIAMKDKNGSTFTISSSRKLNIDPENVGEGPGKEELKLKLKDDNGKERKILMKVPRNQSLPGYNGSILLRGMDVGQAFDIQADVSTVESDSPQIQTTATCTLYVTEYVCRNVDVGSKDANGVKRKEQRCGYEQVSKTGRKPVIEHTRHTQVSAAATFYAPNSQSVLGTFAGSRSDSRTVTDWEGYCELRFGW